jgi:PAS domain S-box-containing protein
MYKFYFLSSIRLYLLLSILATFSAFAEPIPNISSELTEKSIPLHLTDEEKRWLSHHHTLKVGMDPDYAPYEWTDKSGNHIGMAVEYIHRLEKTLGLHFEIVKNKTWVELLDMAKKGELDMLTSIVKTPERSKYLTFSEPYRDAPTIIIDNGNGSFIGSLKQLSNKKVSVEKGYFMEEFMKNNYPKIILLTANSTKEALKMVVDGTVNAYVGDANVAEYVIKTNNFDTLRFSGQTEYISHQSFALTKGNEPLANILTKAMATIPKKETDEMFNHWLNIESGIKQETIAKYGLAIALILFVTGYWVYRLRREINYRKSVEKNLQASKTLYRELTEDMIDVIWKADQNLFITYISPSDERLRGFRADEVIGHHTFEMFTDEGIALITKKMQERKEAEAKGIDLIPTPLEVQYRCKDGSLIWWEVLYKLERDKNGTIIGYHGISREITQRKGMEKEKEILFQELDHRVKNNLQIISSIVSLHSTKKDKSQALEDINNTISAIALAHDKLRHNTAHNTLEIKHYITDLMENLLSSSILEIQKEVNSSEIYLDTQQSITLGLIINEFISNSIKYAFDGVSTPKISVDITETKHFLTLLISDNGVGFQEDKQSSGFGMEIIKTLTKSKFKTDAKFFHNNGTSLELKIVLKKA